MLDLLDASRPTGATAVIENAATLPRWDDRRGLPIRPGLSPHRPRHDERPARRRRGRRAPRAGRGGRAARRGDLRHRLLVSRWCRKGKRASACSSRPRTRARWSTAPSTPSSASASDSSSCRSMAKTVVLVTGANGEIGGQLLQRLAEDGAVRGGHARPHAAAGRDAALVVAASYAGNIMDRYLLDQLAAHHEVDVVFHLAALLSTRGERDPELAHQVNVEGTLNVLRMAQNQSSRLGRPVRFLFPSSIAVYGLPTPRGEARAPGACARSSGTSPSRCTAATSSTASTSGATSRSTRASSARSPAAARIDFRSLRFPGLISADTVAHRRHERLRPRDDPRGGAGRAVHVLRRARGAHPVHGDARRGARAARALARRPRAPLDVRLQHRRLQPERRRRSPSACATRSPARAIDYEPDPVRSEDRRLVARGRGRLARPPRLGLAARVRLGPRVRRVPRPEASRRGTPETSVDGQRPCDRRLRPAPTRIRERGRRIRARSGRRSSRPRR